MDFVTKFDMKMQKLAFEGQAPMKGTELMKNDWSQYGHMLPIALPAATGAMNAMFDNRDNANPVGDFVRGALPMAALAYGAHRYFGAPNAQQPAQPTDTAATTTGAQPGPQAAQPTAGTGTAQPVDANIAGGAKGKKGAKGNNPVPGEVPPGPQAVQTTTGVGTAQPVDANAAGGAKGNNPVPGEVQPAVNQTSNRQVGDYHFDGAQNKVVPFSPVDREAAANRFKAIQGRSGTDDEVFANHLQYQKNIETNPYTMGVKSVQPAKNFQNVNKTNVAPTVTEQKPSQKTVDRKPEYDLTVEQAAARRTKNSPRFSDSAKITNRLSNLGGLILKSSVYSTMLPDYHEKYAFYKQQAFNAVLQEQGLMPREKTASEQYKSIKLAAFIDQWQRKANMR